MNNGYRESFMGSIWQVSRASVLRSNSALQVRSYDSVEDSDTVRYAPDTVLWIHKFYLSILHTRFSPQFVSNLTKICPLLITCLPSPYSRGFSVVFSRQAVQRTFSLIPCHLPEPWFIPLAFMSVQTPNMLLCQNLAQFICLRSSFLLSGSDVCQDNLIWSHTLQWLLTFWWPCFVFLHIIHDYVTTELIFSC